MFLQISIAENHIVFDAKPTRLEPKKKHTVIVFLCFLKQSKCYKSTENTFLVIDTTYVEEIHYFQQSGKLKIENKNVGYIKC